MTPFEEYRAMTTATASGPGESVRTRKRRREELARIGFSGTRPALMRKDLILQDELAFAARFDTLTAMQVLILSLVACGRLNKQVAFECGISEATAKAHVATILKRLNFRSRTEAAVKFAVFIERRRGKLALQEKSAAWLTWKEDSAS
jgi:DNA-binding CsgD family transcriptional regulator